MILFSPYRRIRCLRFVLLSDELLLVFQLHTSSLYRGVCGNGLVYVCALYV